MTVRENELGSMLFGELWMLQACDWLYRHAEGLSVVGLAGPGDSSARPAERPSVLLPWTQRQSSESDLARRSGRMPVYQAAGAGPLPGAERRRRRGDDLFRPAWLPALRYRLASSAGNLASDLCRLTGFACRSCRM